MTGLRGLEDELDLIRAHQQDLAEREAELVERIQLLQRGGRREGEYLENSLATRIFTALNDDPTRVWTTPELMGLLGGDVDRQQVYGCLNFLLRNERVTRIRRGHFQSVLAHGGEIKVPAEKRSSRPYRLEDEIEALLNATPRKVWKMAEVLAAIPELAELVGHRKVFTQLIATKRIRRVKRGHFASVASVAEVLEWKPSRKRVHGIGRFSTLAR